MDQEKTHHICHRHSRLRLTLQIVIFIAFAFAFNICPAQTLRVTHVTRYSYDRPVRTRNTTIRLVPSQSESFRISDFRISFKPESVVFAIEPRDESNRVVRPVILGKISRLEYTTTFLVELTNSPAIPVDKRQPPTSLVNPEQYLQTQNFGPKFTEFVGDMSHKEEIGLDFLFNLNRRVKARFEYSNRDEQGILSPEELLTTSKGSCRDMAALLMHALRQAKIPSRFVSGYAIQHDAKRGYQVGFHAWCEAFIPSTGWIGLDPTWGAGVNKFYIALFRAATPADAGPMDGEVERAVASLEVDMKIEEIKEKNTR